MFDHVDQNKEPLFMATGWISYISVVVISLWGGMVSYFGKKSKFGWCDFLAHLSSSSFAGMMTFFACQHVGITGALTGVLCGIAAHMGTPALVALLKKMPVVKSFFEGTK